VTILTRRLRQMTPFVAIAVALVAILGLATSALAYDISAEAVRNRLSNKINDDWECTNLAIKVTPYQNDGWTQQCRFESVVISADKMTRKGKGVTIRDAYVKGFDVTFDAAKLFNSDPRDPEIKVKSHKSTTLRVKLMEGDVNKLLAMKHGPVEGLAVDFGEGQMTFTGVYKLVVGNKLRLVGRLEVEGKHLINLVPTSASINGLPLPAGPLKQLVGKINPLVDTFIIPLRPKVDKVTITDSYICIEGNS
jgi:hypothetical protein